ncbi:MAG: hypothetical protein NW208_07910 [Bryobacter sp.]|nr:hypothetical protein [Bryobacter sp.]
MMRVFVAVLVCVMGSSGQPLRTIPVEVNFAKKLQPWDGFGFNYVEAAQTRDYAKNPQEYGGYHFLQEKQKEEINALVFGKEGLDVDLLKMFLDPWHQAEAGAKFDHETTTRNMMRFALDGAKRKNLVVLTTLYGPPAWATKQGWIGGRDLDSTKMPALVNYVLDWVGYLRGKGLDVCYVSPHNEGEDFYRWTFEEGRQRQEGFDYNAYWRPEEVNLFVKTAAAEIRRRGWRNLAPTNGEPSNWTRFYHWGYAAALAEDAAALRDLGLVTTHGFVNGDMTKMSYGTAQGLTMDTLQAKRPDLRAWVTSMSWGNMDTRFVRMVHENIYAAGANAVIPWAGIQHAASWIGGDPNPGTAIRVKEDGSYEVTRGYYFYKQLTQAGRRGMRVVYTMAANSQVHVLGFSGEGTPHADAFVVSSSIATWGLPLRIVVKGSRAQRFRAFRTDEAGKEEYRDLGEFAVVGGAIEYDPPKGTTTTFVGVGGS